MFSDDIKNSSVHFLWLRKKEKNTKVLSLAH